MPKPLLIHNWGDKEVHMFPKGIIPKVNVIERLGLKSANNNVAAWLFSHCAIGTPPIMFQWVILPILCPKRYIIFIMDYNM